MGIDTVDVVDHVEHSRRTGVRGSEQLPRRGGVSALGRQPGKRIRRQQQNLTVVNAVGLGEHTLHELDGTALVRR
ncbi:MAG TPA: hypothetical protein VIM10_02980 [Actinopolymorphaceae bacterium]|jgi:hypothetical protein